LSSPDTAVADESPAPEVDELRAGLVEALQRELGEAVVAHHVWPGGDVLFRVTTDSWRRAGELARDVLGCRYFCFLSAFDWMPSPYGRYEDAVIDHPLEPGRTEGQRSPGLGGSDTRFQVFARVTDPRRHLSVVLKADVPDDTMAIESWAKVYAGADWHERETWEMFGIDFVGHPHLRHIYLPSDFEGHPLRKDFPLLARVVKPWPGIVDVEPMPGEDEPAEGEAVTEGAEGQAEPEARPVQDIVPPEPPAEAPTAPPSDAKPAVEAPVERHGESASREQLAEGEQVVAEVEHDAEGDTP
jgi:NADH-quinone oxidoreductase subunit C